MGKREEKIFFSSFLPILRAAVLLARSSLSITVDEKRKGLQSKLAKIPLRKPHVTFCWDEVPDDKTRRKSATFWRAAGNYIISENSESDAQYEPL